MERTMNSFWNEIDIFAPSIEGWAIRQFGPLDKWEQRKGHFCQGETHAYKDKEAFYFLFVFLNCTLINMMVLLANCKRYILRDTQRP